MKNSFIRRRRGLSEKFTILGNDVLCDENLSWRGLGVLCFLLHLPADFQTHLQHVSSIRKKRGTRATATSSAFAELCAAGYMLKEYLRDGQGRIVGTVWHVSDQPIFRAGSDSEPIRENPSSVNQKSDFQCLQSTKSKKKEVLQSTTTGVVVDFSLEELLEATQLQQKLLGKDMGIGLKKKVTERFADLRCNDMDIASVENLRLLKLKHAEAEERKRLAEEAELQRQREILEQGKAIETGCGLSSEINRRRLAKARRAHLE